MAGRCPESNSSDVFKDDMKVLVSTVTSPSLLEDPRALDTLFKTESWQTLMTFTRESARKCNIQPLSVILLSTSFHPASLPSTSAPGPSSSQMDEDIPQDVFDQIAADEGVRREGPSGVSSRIKICPHCTFENPAEEMDCQVCLLPLG